MSQKQAQLLNPINGNINVSGIITATSFVGSGEGLTGVASTDNIQTSTGATFLSNVNVSGITTLTTLQVTGLTTVGIVTGGTSVSATHFYGASFIPTGSAVPTNGVYLPAVNNLAFATNNSERIRVGSAGQIGVAGTNYGTSGQVLTSGGAGAAVTWATVSNAVSSVNSETGVVVLDAADVGAQPFDADTAKTDIAQTYTAAQVGAITTLTDGATIAPDFSLSNNFTLTLTAAGRTLANPTNVTAGQSGVIVINQDGTGSRTITTYGSYFKFAGGTAPDLSTGANDIDALSYYCVSSTIIIASLGADFS
jgi:hypothetical protein